VAGIEALAKKRGKSNCQRIEEEEEEIIIVAEEEEEE
jgi:hypothetical protein